jgi:thiol-disulfide isomerase/thioredoxin
MNTRHIYSLSLLAALALPVAALQDSKPTTGGDGKPAAPADAKPAEKPEAERPLKLGATVHESVALRDMDGKSITFKDLRGKTVLIHFWSDRCPAEKHADPVMKQLESYYKDKKDVVIIGIASNQGEIGPAPEAGADFSKLYENYRKKLKEIGFTHKIYIDHGNKLSDLFQAVTTPHCFVVDAKGALRYSGALDDNLDESKGDAAKIYVRDAVDALLAGKDIEVKETKPYG